MLEDGTRPLRDDVARLDARLEGARGVPARTTPAFVGKVASPDADIAVGAFLVVHPATLSGGDAAGAAATAEVDAGSSVPVLLLGPARAKTGDLLVCKFVEYRWVAERGFDSTPPPPPVCKSIQFDARGCATRQVNGVLVSATDGTSTVSGVTSSSTGTAGRLYLSVPNPGSWAWTATPPFGSHWTGASGTKVVPACGTFPLLTQRINLGVESGYSCQCDPCCPSASYPCPIIVWPSLVYLNDGIGLVAMNGGGPNSPAWSGATLRRAASAWDCAAGAVVHDVDVPVFFFATCGAAFVDFGRCSMGPYAGCYNGPYPCTTDDCGRLYAGNPAFGNNNFSSPFGLAGNWSTSITCPPPVASGAIPLGDGSTPIFPGTTHFDPKYPAYQVYGPTLGLGLSP